MSPPFTLQLRFFVPSAAQAAVSAELGEGKAASERASLAALYVDTADRHLARQGLAWQLRREGRRWIQALSLGSGHLLAHVEHEVIRPDDTTDAGLHAGTEAGERLRATLHKAASDDQSVAVRFRSECHRTGRRIRTGGASVDLAYDDGRLVAQAHASRVRSLAFMLASGEVSALMALAQRWQKRFALVLDPRSLAERGDWLAQGQAWPPVRKAARPLYPHDAEPTQALGAVVDECLAQVLHNTFGLIEGDPAQRVEHVHQLRVGIRRLRSGLRCFEGWAPMPPDELVAGLRALFTQLAESRDADVLDSGVAQALDRAGAPALSFDAAPGAAEPAALLRGDPVQRLLLQWLAWRASLIAPQAGASADADADAGPGATAPADTAQATDQPGEAPAVTHPVAADAPADGRLPRRAARRLARWHRRLADEARRFPSLEEPAVHDLRKRIKRQRYALEFLAPLLRRKLAKNYLAALAAAQEAMGELNDLFVARDRYAEALRTQPQAWFALGWLSAKIEEVRATTAPVLRRLAKCEPPEAAR